MGKIDDDAQPIAFLDDGCAKWGQAAIARGIGVRIAQRHSGVAVVQQAKMPQAPPVRFFHALKMALQKMPTLHCLDHRWLPILMRGAHVMPV